MTKHNLTLGAKGESLAAAYLKKSGYKILDRNLKTPYGEVDIVAKKGEVIAFVEVKTRISDDFGAPREAVDRERQLRYIRAATVYFKKHPDSIIRFDVIEVGTDRINHIENAFY